MSILLECPGKMWYWRNAETALRPVAMGKMGQRGSFRTLLYLGDETLSYLFVSSSSVSQWMLLSRESALDMTKVPREASAPESWDSAPARTIRAKRTADPQVDGQTPRPSTNCIGYHVIDGHVISPWDNRSASLMTSIAAIFCTARRTRSAWFVSISGTTGDCSRAIIFAVGLPCPT